MENKQDKFYDQNGIVVRRSIKNDIEYLKDHLRDSDVQEVLASSGRTPEEALKESLEDSIFACTILNGKPIGVFGIVPQSLLGNKASIWFVATDDLTKIQRRFARNSKQFISMMLDFYPYLFNYVDNRNTKSIKWLKSCGATIEEPKPYGVKGLPFRYFYFQRGGK